MRGDMMMMMMMMMMMNVVVERVFAREIQAMQIDSATKDQRRYDDENSILNHTTIG